MRINHLFNFFLILCACLPFDSKSQDTTGLSKYIQLKPASAGSPNYRFEIASDVDSTGWLWQDSGYNFGFNK